jgi:hypothetical protein
METCYKAFRRAAIQSIVLNEGRFGFEPEVTVKSRSGACGCMRSGYSGRTHQEGKKISWKNRGTRPLA